MMSFCAVTKAEQETFGSSLCYSPVLEAVVVLRIILNDGFAPIIS